MTPDQQAPDPAPAAKPEPAADAYDWGPDPPPFTAEEIEDIKANGVDLGEVIASIRAEIARRKP